jgi:hypothetical protein
MCGGGGIPIVSDAVNAVSDVFDKADNWTEGAGEMLADIDPGPALGDAGEFIDKSVIQPMKEDPLAAIATIAAIATGQAAWALPLIAATSTAAHGGSLEDIALSAGVAYVAGQVAPSISQSMPAATSIAGRAAAGAATGAIIGAGSGATVAAVKGKDVGAYALRGGVAGGVVGGVAGGVKAGGDYYRGTPELAGVTPITQTPANTEFGFDAGAAPSADVNAPIVPEYTPTEFGLKATTGGNTEFGIDYGQPPVKTPLYADYGNINTELGIGRSSSFGINADSGKTFGELSTQGSGSTEFGINPGSPETTPLVGMASLSPAWTYTAEDELKKVAGKILKNATMEALFGSSGGGSYIGRSSTGATGTAGADTFSGYTDPSSGADTNVALNQVMPSKYELRKYGNDTGNTTLVPFKDNQPQAPIPSGYKELEVVGAAKGGLLTKPSKKSKSIVQSKNALAAPKQDKLPTTRKGLAVK